MTAPARYVVLLPRGPGGSVPPEVVVVHRTGERTADGAPTARTTPARSGWRSRREQPGHTGQPPADTPVGTPSYGPDPAACHRPTDGCTRAQPGCRVGLPVAVGGLAARRMRTGGRLRGGGCVGRCGGRLGRA
ncbi:DUF6296 family protein [Kitasatospora sp. NPDC054939]